MRKEGPLKRKTRIAVSAVSGIAAAMIALGYASTVRAEADRAREEALAKYGGDMVQVCVATRDIEPGEAIDEGNVIMEDWVAGLLPADAGLSLDAVVGRTATSRIPGRAVLCPVYFKAREAGIEIPEGAVAVSVAADEAHAVGGALGRGDAVDVYVSRDGVADRLCAASVVDTNALAEGGGAVRWVTLAVGPESVEELLMATAVAPVTLVVPGAEVGRAGGATASEPTDEALVGEDGS